MKELINEINLRINAEKLLFSDVNNYSDEQAKLIITELAKSLEENKFYVDLIATYMTKLLDLSNKYKNSDELKEEVEIIKNCAVEWSNKSKTEKKEDSCFIDLLFGKLIGRPDGETYFDFVKNRIMDVTRIREVFDNNCAYEVFNNDVNFMVTNNFLLLQYPEFYSESDLSQLKLIAKSKDEKSFDDSCEYHNFKKVSSSTMIHLRRYENHNNKKIKMLKKD